MNIVTKRLVIRDFTEDDAQAWSAYRSKPEVARWQSWDEYTVEDALKRIRWCQSHPFTGRHHDNAHYAVTLSDGTLIGDVRLESLGFRSVALGYTIDSAYWHQGYGREASAAALYVMKTHYGMRKAMAWIYKRNTRSRALLEALGFKKFSESAVYQDEGYKLRLDRLVGLDEDDIEVVEP